MISDNGEKGGIYMKVPSHEVVEGINPFSFNSASEISSLQEVLNINSIKSILSESPSDNVESLEELQTSIEQQNIPVDVYGVAREFAYNSVIVSLPELSMGRVNESIIETLRSLSGQNTNDASFAFLQEQNIRKHISLATARKSKDMSILKFDLKGSAIYADTEFLDKEPTATVTQGKGPDLRKLPAKSLIFIGSKEYVENREALTKYFEKHILIVQQPDGKDGYTYVYVNSSLNRDLDITNDIKGAPFQFATLGTDLDVSALVAQNDSSLFVKLESVVYKEDSLYNYTPSDVSKVDGVNSIRSLPSNVNVDGNVGPVVKQKLEIANRRTPKKAVTKQSEVIEAIGGRHLITVENVRTNSEIKPDAVIFLNSKHLVKINKHPFKVAKITKETPYYTVGGGLYKDIDAAFGPVHDAFNADDKRDDFRNLFDNISDLVSPDTIDIEITDNKPNNALKLEIGSSVPLSRVYGYNAYAYVRAIMKFDVENKRNINKIIHSVAIVYGEAMNNSVLETINKLGGLEFIRRMKFYGGDTKSNENKKAALIEAYISTMINKHGHVFDTVTVEEYADLTITSRAEAVKRIANDIERNSDVYVDMSYIGAIKGNLILKIDNTDTGLASNDETDIRSSDEIINNINDLLSVSDYNSSTSSEKAISIAALHTAIDNRFTMIDEFSHSIHNDTAVNTKSTIKKFNKIFGNVRLINTILKSIGTDMLLIPRTKNVFEKPMNDKFVVGISKLTDSLLYRDDTKEDSDFKADLFNGIYNTIFNMSKEKFDENVVTVFNNHKYVNKALADKIAALEEKVKSEEDSVARSEDINEFTAKLEKSQKSLVELNLLKQNFSQKTFQEYKDLFDRDVVNAINDLANTLVLDMFKQQYAVTNLMEDSGIPYGVIVEALVKDNGSYSSIKLKYDTLFESLSSLDINNLPTLRKSCGK
jgi:hypothetical protein